MAGRKYLKMQLAIPNESKALWQRKVFQDHCTVQGLLYSQGTARQGNRGGFHS